jgi:hypothetical protein
MNEQKKICTKCNAEKPNTTEFFHLDKGKTVSACKVCKNAQKLQYNRDRYKRVGKQEAKIQYTKHREKRLAYWKRADVAEKRRKRVMEKYHKNPQVFAERRKKVVEKHKQKYAERNRNYDKKRIDELSDTYILQLMVNYFGITRVEAKENKELFDTYKSHLKLKRLCRV